MHFISGTNSHMKIHILTHTNIHKHTDVYINMIEKLEFKYLIITGWESDIIYQEISATSSILHPRVTKSQVEVVMETAI